MTRAPQVRRGVAAILVAAIAAAGTSCRPAAGQWTDLAMPAPAPQLGVEPNPPACAPSGFCLLTGAVASADGIAYYATSWNGGRWATVPPADEPQLLSCASATTCALANDDTLGIFDGSRWRLFEDTEVFPDRSADDPLLVSCGATDRCVAVNGERAVSWDGTGWSRAPGAPSGARGISCVGPAFCLALGDPTGATFRWDGTTWTPTPRFPTGDEVGIENLTCWAVDACLIAASRTDVTQPGQTPTRHPHSYRWDGTTFHFVDVPVGVASLSCVDERHCMAMVPRPVPGPVQPPAELHVRNGGGWQAAPLPFVGRTRPSPMGVACAASWCLATAKITPVGPGPVAAAYRWTFT